MMNESVFDYHINRVIPNTILANKEFFLQNIIREPKNMDYFITKDTYKKACIKMGLEVSNISCNFTANIFNGFFVVFGEFLNINRGIAIATKDNTLRYFTYTKQEVGEWLIGSDRLGEFKKYQKTSSYKMSLFAGVVASILEG